MNRRSIIWLVRPFLGCAVAGTALIGAGVTPAVAAAQSGTIHYYEIHEPNGPAPAPWILSSDFAAHPAENPTPSHGGAAWYYLQSTSLAHTGGYRRLGTYNPEFLGLKGYGQWTGSALAANPSALSPTGYPYIGVNSSARNADPPAEYSTPPGAVVVHPNGPGAGNGPPALAIIGWKSPLTGRVRASASFSGVDTVCGKTRSVSWSIDSGAQVIRHGSVLHGSSTGVLSVTTPVHTGGFLYFAVGPIGVPACDATRVMVSVTRG